MSKQEGGPGRAGQPGRRRPPARSKKMQPAAQTLRPPAEPDLLLHRLLYRDGLVLIIDKPAGLPVHAGPGGGANVEQYLDALRFGLPGLPAHLPGGSVLDALIA